MIFILLRGRDESGSIMAGVVAFESKTFLCKVL